MPNYSSHLILNFFLLAVGFVLYVQYPFLTPIQLAIFILGYFIGTVFVSPDLDTKSSAARRCGVLCTPYRKMFTHRGISHHWLWGTVTRIIYVLIVIGFFAGLVYVLKLPLPDITIILTHPLELLLLIQGIFISNLLHTVIDTIF